MWYQNTCIPGVYYVQFSLQTHDASLIDFMSHQIVDFPDICRLKKEQLFAALNFRTYVLVYTETKKRSCDPIDIVLL